MLGALVGSLVESLWLQAAYPDVNESPHEALGRIRPVAAILVDALADEAESDLFLARARRRHIRLLLFGSDSALGPRRAWAETNQIPAYALPEELDTLRFALEHVLDAESDAPRGSDRRAGIGERRPDGRLVFEDGAGMRWTVYDRRGADRRANLVDRRFVSDTGQVWRCEVSFEESQSLSIEHLARQLARAESLARE